MSCSGITSGGVVERFMAAVLKTAVGKPTVGSNPTPSAIRWLNARWPQSLAVPGNCQGPAMGASPAESCRFRMLVVLLALAWLDMLHDPCGRRPVRPRDSGPDLNS